MSHTDFNPAVMLDSSVHRKGVEFFFHFFSVSHHCPDLPLLENILGAFSHLPYENISKIIKHRHETESSRKLRFPSEIMEDHARFHLGGTCFSLTFFLQTILLGSGFVCYPVLADMRAGRNMHCALVVMLDSNKYLVDPGYLLNRPLEMDPAKPRVYDSDFTGVELVFYPHPRTYDLFTFNKTQMKWRYRFIDRPVPCEEFLQQWLSSFNWNSMHGLCLTKVEKGRMVFIHKTHMRETTYTAKKNTNIKNQVHQTIESIFGIDSRLVESALAALQVNMARERELGLWVPNPHPIGIRL